MDPLFFELHSGLEHEAPGSAADTLAALAASGLSGPAHILDAGCGPGAAAVTLLQALPEARVTAIDLHAAFIEAARARAEAAGVGGRLTAVVADMAAPPVARGSFDAVWSEGAAYAIGLPAALAAWRPLLKPGGRIVVSELVWAGLDRPEAAVAYWAEGYPDMTDRAGTLGRIVGAGLTPLADLPVSEAGWAAYYEPLETRGAVLAARHGADHPVLAENAAEIAMWRAHGDAVEYRFFVAAA